MSAADPAAWRSGTASSRGLLVFARLHIFIRTTTIPAEMTASLTADTPSSTIERLKLLPHPEGGYFAVTWIEPKQVGSPYANGAKRSVATCIFYYLSLHVPRDLASADPVAANMPKGWRSGVGVLHTNKSPTMHLLQKGVTRYTLIRAAKPWGPYDPNAKPYTLPEIRTVTMGPNLAAGEVLQLLVESGWWKVSMLPGLELDSSKEAGNESGALVSEVVTPGFEWDDHMFMRLDDLQALLPYNPELVKKYSPFIRPPE